MISLISKYHGFTRQSSSWAMVQLELHSVENTRKFSHSDHYLTGQLCSCTGRPVSHAAHDRNPTGRPFAADSGRPCSASLRQGCLLRRPVRYAAALRSTPPSRDRSCYTPAETSSACLATGNGSAPLRAYGAPFRSAVSRRQTGVPQLRSRDGSVALRDGSVAHGTAP